MGVMGSEIEFKSYEQHQGALFPAHLSEALDPGDPVFFISDWLESTDVSAFEQRYAVQGERAYPPRVLLKLWLFGAIDGVYPIHPDSPYCRRARRGGEWRPRNRPSRSETIRGTGGKPIPRYPFDGF